MSPVPRVTRTDPDREAFLAALDESLFGDRDSEFAAKDVCPSAIDGGAVDWRAFSAELRALAPPTDPGFEHRLELRLADRADGRGRLRRSSRAAGSRLRASWRARSALVSMGRRRVLLLGGPAAVAIAIAIALIVALEPASMRNGSSVTSRPGATFTGESAASGGAARHSSAGPFSLPADGAGAGKYAAEPAPQRVAEGEPWAAAGSRRLRALGASITLRPTSSRVQSTSDRAARLAAREGGYVLSSHVEASRGGSSEAELILSIPSAKLAATIATLGRLAPIGAESQSLRDITGSFDSTRSALREARTERAALLRALDAAEGEERIERLRRELARVRREISGQESALRSTLHRAHEAQVEVTIRGPRPAAGSGLSVNRGLHDALRVLTVAFVVLLLACAALLPAALLAGVSTAVLRAWRRARRESALDVS